jgi:hypothetical protein
MILQKVKRFKKILFTSFLFPIVPVLSIPGENGENENNENQDNANSENSNSENGNDGNREDGNNSSGQVIFKSQAEFDNLLKNRINKAIKKTKEDLEAEKKKENLSELEKLKFEKEEADKKLIEATNKSNQMLIQSKVISVASKLKIRDPEAAFILMDKDDVSIDNGKVLGIENSLKALIKEKPYLLDPSNNDSNNQDPQSGGDDQNAGSNKPNGSSVDMNYLIRRKAGYMD